MANPQTPAAPQLGEYVGITEAARILGVHAQTVRRWADSGALRCVRPEGIRGSHRRFRRSDLTALSLITADLDTLARATA